MKRCSSNTCSVHEEAQIGVEDALGLKMNVLNFEQVLLLFKLKNLHIWCVLRIYLSQNFQQRAFL